MNDSYISQINDKLVYLREQIQLISKSKQNNEVVSILKKCQELNEEVISKASEIEVVVNDAINMRDDLQEIDNIFTGLSNEKNNESVENEFNQLLNEFSQAEAKQIAKEFPVFNAKKEGKEENLMNVDDSLLLVG